MAKGTAKSLTKPNLKRFKAALEAKAVEIRESLRSAKASKALSRGEEPLDEEELPGQSHEEWIFLNRNHLDVMLLRQIEEALVRIQDNDYGTCMECEEPISMKRLDAVPWARYCVPCQEELSAAYPSDGAHATGLFSEAS
jgi:RNA polymerase-binding transcription factor